jgi:hypothetical protein
MHVVLVIAEKVCRNVPLRTWLENVSRKYENKTPGLFSGLGFFLHIQISDLRQLQGPVFGPYLGHASNCYTTTLGDEDMGSYFRLFLAKHYFVGPIYPAKESSRDYDSRFISISHQRKHKQKVPRGWTTLRQMPRAESRVGFGLHSDVVEIIEDRNISTWKSCPAFSWW